MTVQIRILPGHDTATVEPIWAALEQRVGAGRLTISWTWTATWLRHFGNSVRYWFAIAERAGEPIGAVLLVVSRRGPRAFPLRQLHLGTAGEPRGQTVFVEYNDLLCANADRAEIAHALGEAIRHVPGWDELNVDGFCPGAAQALRSAIPLALHEDSSWTIRLDPGRPVLQQVSASTRRLIRQARESLQPGEPQRAVDPAEAKDILAELAELHQIRWTAAGEPGVFASDRLSGFLEDLTAAWQPTGALELFRLRGAQGTIGCVLGFVENGRFLYYQGGMRQFADNRKRSGLLCHAVFAEHCRRRGLAEYELLAGDAQYKRQLSGGEHNTLVWGYYGRRSLRGRLVTAARGVRRARAERRAVLPVRRNAAYASSRAAPGMP